MEKRGWKLLRNNFISVILVVGLICLGVVFAGNVFVDQGSMEVSEDVIIDGQLGMPSTTSDDLINVAYSPVDDGGAFLMQSVYQPSDTSSATRNYRGISMVAGPNISSGVWNPGYFQAMRLQATADSALKGGIKYLYSISGVFGLLTGATGNVTHVYGLRLTPYIQAGTITGNLYSILIDDTTTGGTLSGDEYTIYSANDAPSYFAGDIGIGTPSPSYPLEVNDDVSDISIYASKNISATGYITRTSVFDKSQGSALDKVKDADDLKTDGVIDHSKFYGYAGEFEVTDYSKPETREECMIDELSEEEVCHDVNYYPYTKTEEGVSLNAEIDVLRQAVFELKVENQMLKDELCKKDNSHSWC